MSEQIDLYEDMPNNVELRSVSREFTGIKSQYDASYCGLVMQHCSNGESIESFAGKEHIDPDKLQLWAKDYPEFKAALKCAISAEYLFWSTQLRDSLANEALAFRLPSINRKMSQLEATLLKNSIRRTLFSNYEDIPELSNTEIIENELLSDFIKA